MKKPKYEALADSLLRKINRGVYPGSKLPSMSAIAKEYAVNLQTANRAVKFLEQQGIVTCFAGKKGTVINAARATLSEVGKTGSSSFMVDQVFSSPVRNRLRFLHNYFNDSMQNCFKECARRFTQRYPWTEIEIIQIDTLKRIENDEIPYDTVLLNGRDVSPFARKGHFFIATSNTFKNAEIVFAEATEETSIVVPANVLRYGVTHYVRVTVTTPYMTVTSASNMFVTADIEMVPPVIIAPMDGETVEGTSVLLKWQETPNNGFRLEWAKSASFPNRSKKIKTVDMGVCEYILEDLTEGTWYVRIATIKKDESWTDFSEVVAFTYSPTTNIENTWSSEANGMCYDLLGRPIGEPQSGQIVIQNGKLIYQL